MNYDFSQMLAAWGHTPEADPKPTTLRALQRVLETALDSGLNEELCQSIQEGTEHLLREFQIVVNEAERTANSLPDYSPLHRLYDLTLDSYEAAYEAIEAFTEIHPSWQQGALQKGLSALQEAVQKIAESQDLWKAQVHNTAPSCASCGYSEQSSSSCPHCRTDLLYPDSRGRESEFSEQAVLGPDFHNVFKQYLELKSGRSTLAQVLHSTGPLRKTVSHWSALIRSGALDELEAGLAQTLKHCVAESSEGLRQMELAQQTRRWQDINDGWRRLFKSGASLQRALPELYRATGQEVRADALEASFRTRDFASA